MVAVAAEIRAIRVQPLPRFPLDRVCFNVENDRQLLACLPAPPKYVGDSEMRIPGALSHDLTLS
jgi:hypothetical protein